MLVKRASDISSSEITSENLYHNRREFIKTASAALGIAAAAIIPACAPSVGAAAEPQAKKGPYDTTEKPSRKAGIARCCARALAIALA